MAWQEYGKEGLWCPPDKPSGYISSDKQWGLFHNWLFKHQSVTGTHLAGREHDDELERMGMCVNWPGIEVLNKIILRTFNTAFDITLYIPTVVGVKRLHCLMPSATKHQVDVRFVATPTQLILIEVQTRALLISRDFSRV